MPMTTKQHRGFLRGGLFSLGLMAVNLLGISNTHPASTNALSANPVKTAPKTTMATVTTAMTTMTRRRILWDALSFGMVAANLLGGSKSVHAFSSNPVPSAAETMASTIASSSSPTSLVAYKTLALPLAGYGINVPVSCWFPVDDATKEGLDPSSSSSSSSKINYNYQINVQRIGQLLAGWDFIPSFASRRFEFETRLLNGQNLSIPKGRKVVVLAHGYLGSPLDLGHIAEGLAQEGYVCVAAEYAESLEASYPRPPDGLERRVINDRLLQYLADDLQPLSYSALGHSMGAGTVLQIGDETWNRVLLGIGKVPPIKGEINGKFGRFADPGGRLLLITSTNDGAVKFGGGITVPDGYTVLTEEDVPSASAATRTVIPDRAALVFDRVDAPNHISFLAENTNEAMISFLSPLLPVAKAFEIPVLDFDKYVTSRDSVQTAAIIRPLISNFLASSGSQTQ